MIWRRKRAPSRAGGEGSKRILEIANVDFAMKQFLHPLMQALRDAGHHVEGGCADGPHLATLREDGFVVHALPMARSYSPIAQFRALRALIRLIRRMQPDLVHGHMPISGLLARVAAWWCGVPCIAYTCHGFLFNQPGSFKRRALSFVLEWAAGQITDRYMTVSHAEARDARRLYIHRGAQGIGNGRDPARYRPDAQARAEIRQALGLGDDQVVIIAVSRIVRHKGYPELLRAMESVPDAVLVIVGERLPSDHGDMMGQEFARATEILGSRLKLLGYRDDTQRVLAAADIFTLPSHFEGLPMSVIEAMLTGLPVVATDIRGPAEQIVSGESGLLVPPGLAAPLSEALTELVRDPSRRQAMGEAARARAVALYGQKRVLERVVAILS
ncbi:glycosyltransferase family 4 protein [Asaia siamensis]|uniref:Glycosyl transferase n=1 Tax=Asaia siamensis TaxID=110479 RepID=A0ABQ1LCX6_9PROT|nr:glycosyltransferase family 4 protein [Asaia siamensis]GBR09114.1 glycosyltransferase [Asaia siamensis NRIC 0323]GGC20882.1 glycosyl transferase [Asaia siamensis]